jgi:hypothetical protein
MWPFSDKLGTESGMASQSSVGIKILTVYSRIKVILVKEMLFSYTLLFWLDNKECTVCTSTDRKQMS